MKTRLPTGVLVVQVKALIGEAMKVQMKLLMMEVVGGEVTVVEVAQTAVALEVEVFGAEENVGALVAEGNEEALVAEVDQMGKVLVVDGDQTEDPEEAEAVEGMTDLVVGATVVILARMDPLTGRRGWIMLKGGRVIMGLGLGTRIVVTRRMEGAGLQQVVELVVVGTVIGQNRRQRLKTMLAGPRERILVLAGPRQQILLQIRVNHLVGMYQQQMVLQALGAKKMMGVAKVDGNYFLERAK